MSNYNKVPFFPIPGKLYSGWEEIRTKISVGINNTTKESYVVVVECYQGVHHAELMTELNLLSPSIFINSKDAFYSEDNIYELTYPDVIYDTTDLQ